MKKHLIRLLSLTLIGSQFLLAGCGSIIDGTNEILTIRSSEDNTKIYVDGILYGKDTAVAKIKRGSTPIIQAKKANCRTTTVRTERSINPTTFLGILIDFGIITIPLDLLTGGFWELDQDQYVVTPSC